MTRVGHVGGSGSRARLPPVPSGSPSGSSKYVIRQLPGWLWGWSIRLWGDGRASGGGA